MNINKNKIITVLDGIIIFNINTNEEEIIPSNLEYPKQYRQYCQRDENYDDFVSHRSNYIGESDGKINISEIEKIINYKPIVFRTQDGIKVYSHLIELNENYSMIMFTSKMWVTLYRYLSVQLFQLYDNNKPLFYQTIHYFIKCKIQPSTHYLSYPRANISFNLFPFFSEKSNNCGELFSSQKKKYYTESIRSDAFGFLFQFPENILRGILTTILNERRLVVIGKNVNEVAVFVLLILELLQPFEWEHLVITHLPREMINILQSPIPYIIGIKADDFNCDSLNDNIILNIDNLRLQTTDLETMQHDIDCFPNDLFNILMNKIKDIQNNPNLNLIQKNHIMKNTFFLFMSEFVRNIREFIYIKDDKKEKPSQHEQMITGGYSSLQINDTIDNVNEYFNDTNEYNNYLNENMNNTDEKKVVFDEKKFIKKNEKHLRPFLEQFKQTTLFQQYVNDLIIECLQFPLPSQLK